MYNSQYYTCEQIDERLLQGYLDDYNTQNGTSLTKAQFLTQLATIMGKNATIDNIVAQIGYYVCETAAGTAAKTLAAANYELLAGGSLKVKFLNKNTANNVTLNINGKGAKALYYQGDEVSSSNTWEANEVVEIFYDGTDYYANNVKGGSGDGVYDVSVNIPDNGNPSQYGSLSDALAAVPVNVRKPGMSIKFINSSNSRYEQWRYMLSTLTGFTTVANWQGVDDEPTAGSKNLVKSGGIHDTIAEESTIGKKYLRLYNDFGGFTEKKYSLDGDGSISGPKTGSSASNYACMCQTIPVNKGAILQISGHTSQSARFAVGITTTPITQDNFAGIVYDLIFNKMFDGDCLANIIVPYDGYIIYYRLTSYWDSFESIKVFNVQQLKDNSVLDVSELNNSNYASLTDALAAVPTTLQKGGMSIKFFNLTTGNYEQYTLLTNSWSTSSSYWRGVDSIISSGSKNLIESGGVFEGAVLYAGQSKTNPEMAVARNNISCADRIGGYANDKIDISGLSLKNFSVSEDGKISSVGKSIVISIFPNRTYRVVSTESSVIYSVLAQVPTTADVGGNAVFATGYDSRVSVSLKAESTFVAPDDAVCVVMFAKNSSGIEKRGDFYEIGKTQRNIAELSERVAGTETDITSLENELVEKTSYYEEVPIIVSTDVTGVYTIKSKYIDAQDRLIFNSTVRSAFVYVSSGTSYKVETNDLNVAVLDAVDFDNNILSFNAKYPSRFHLTEDTIIEIPSNATYLYLNIRNTSGVNKTYALYNSISIQDAVKKIENSGNDSFDGDEVIWSKVRIANVVGHSLMPHKYERTSAEDSRAVPATKGELSAHKRASQMYSIVWTPKADIPSNTGTFAAGTPVTGLPYSSVKEIDKFIGYDVSIHCFMTALNNPYSLLYTENVKGTSSQSIWGKTYHGTNCASYMGTVCSSFACYAAGIPCNWPTSHNKYLYKYTNVFSKNHSQDAQGLRIGDIMWLPGHNCFISGLTVRANGNVTYVELSQSGAPHVVVNNLSSNSFREYLLANNAIMYRYLELDLHANDYKATPFCLIDDEYLYNAGDVVYIDGDSKTFYECVNANSDSSFDAQNWREIPNIEDVVTKSAGMLVVVTGNGVNNLHRVNYDRTSTHKYEGICLPWDSYPFTYNNDICTFAGDRASFREGELVVLNYNLDESMSYNWDSIELYKDDVLLNTFTLANIDQSELPEGQRGHALKLGTELTYGSYKARMKNGSTYSDFTYFEVIQTNVNYTANYDDNESMSKIEWSSANGLATFVDVCTLSGSHSVEYEPTEDDITNGYAIVDLNALKKEISGTELSGTLYLKVTFKGEYGAVTNEMIAITSGSDDEDTPDD